MSIVAAGMHAALCAGGVRKPGLFKNGQRVHVGSKCDRVSVAAWNVPQYAGSTGKAGLECHAGIGELTLHDLTGAMFFVSQFGMLVQIMADVYERSRHGETPCVDVAG